MAEPTDTSRIRKLRRTDRDAVRAHFLRLDAVSRHQRFAMSASDQFLSDYADRCLALDAIVYGSFEGDAVRGLGELRPLAGFSREAEAAFSVEAGHQGRGIGSELMQRTLLAARNRRIRRLYMNCLATNGRMQRMARRFGADFEYMSGDVVALVLPRSASPWSMMREAVADGWLLPLVLRSPERRLEGAA